MLFLVIFTPWEKVSCPTRPVRHAGHMGNFDPSPSYPWVKKPKFLLKPTYDVGEQNYLSQFYVYHVVGQNFTLSQHAKNPTSLFVLSDTNFLASYWKWKKKYKYLIFLPYKVGL